ncbi:hypothetical protein BCR43DRAFT_499689 [Syncephalastrum racemosum]|uniref:Uncharacterized protein n=1 Tax=Syncephalastrum racemosum TaxID=13706 RepID=A0A1X2GZE5_SYNRA|nr:hypothetical protein BCR43DRAFT_499689 [Syncephalastrum racemosum]
MEPVGPCASSNGTLAFTRFNDTTHPYAILNIIMPQNLVSSSLLSSSSLFCLALPFFFLLIAFHIFLFYVWKRNCRIYLFLTSSICLFRSLESSITIESIGDVT